MLEPTRDVGEEFGSEIRFEIEIGAYVCAVRVYGIARRESGKHLGAGDRVRRILAEVTAIDPRSPPPPRDLVRLTSELDAERAVARARQPHGRRCGALAACPRLLRPP